MFPTNHFEEEDRPQKAGFVDFENEFDPLSELRRMRQDLARRLSTLQLAASAQRSVSESLKTSARSVETALRPYDSPYDTPCGSSSEIESDPVVSESGKGGRSHLYQKTLRSLQPPFYKTPGFERGGSDYYDDSAESSVDRVHARETTSPRTVVSPKRQATDQSRPKRQSINRSLPIRVLERLNLTKNFWIRLGHANNPSIKQRLAHLKRELKGELKGELKVELKTELKEEVVEVVQERLRVEFIQHGLVSYQVGNQDTVSQTLSQTVSQTVSHSPVSEKLPVPPVEPPKQIVEAKVPVAEIKPLDAVRDVHFTRSSRFVDGTPMTQGPSGAQPSLYPRNKQQNEEWANLYVPTPVTSNPSGSRLAPPRWKSDHNPAPLPTPTQTVVETVVKTAVETVEQPIPAPPVKPAEPAKPIEKSPFPPKKRFDESKSDRILRTGKLLDENEPQGFITKLLGFMNLVLILLGFVGIIMGTIVCVRTGDVKTALGLPVALIGLTIILVGVAGRMYQDFADRKRKVAV